MAFSEFEMKKYQKLVDAFIQERRPPVHLRDNTDLGFRIQQQSVEIFEIRPFLREPNKKVEVPVAKATYLKSRQLWKIYWLRADMKWHGYEPKPEVKKLETFLRVVDEDEYGCFWG